MPELRTRKIFISHAWRYSAHYDKAVEWFNQANNALPDKTLTGLSSAMTRQINPSQVVLILGGMYAAHSSWIEYEINEAKRPKKPIVGVKPWGQERIPQIVQEASWCDPVGWNALSVVGAVRDYC